MQRWSWFWYVHPSEIKLSEKDSNEDEDFFTELHKDDNDSILSEVIQKDDEIDSRITAWNKVFETCIELGLNFDDKKYRMRSSMDAVCQFIKDLKESKPKYRMLKLGEIIQEGDEFRVNGSDNWEEDFCWTNCKIFKDDVGDWRRLVK